MKPLIKITYITFILLLSYSCAVQKQQQPQYTQNQQVGFQVFYDELSPYGNWVDYSNYGYIWIPDVRREFAPYSTNGHWVMTDYGWTWVSDYRWGWAPFHYGRWDYDNYYGWFWVPGNEWGPAWVTWRGGNGYYGWAPMRPGMNINSSYNNEYRDINRWHFVRDRDFGRNDLDRYYVNRGNYTTIIHNSTIINNTTVDRRRNTTYVAGPPEDNVQRATGRNINRVRIQDNQRPGEKLGNNELKIYRPQVERNADSRTTPPKVTDIREIKPVRERGSGNSRNSITPIENTGEQRQTHTPQRERRRIVKQSVDQPPTEKSTQIPQTKTTSPEMPPAQQDQNERRRTERQRIQEVQRQSRQMEKNRPGVSQQSTPQPPVSEQKEIQQEQQVKQDITKQEQLQKQQQLQIQRQQQQVERQQQQLERQQQMQRRRLERQQTRQQQQIEKSQPIPSTQPGQQQNEQEQKEAAPSGSRRR